MIVEFGKFKGMDIQQVPDDYLKMCFNEGDQTVNCYFCHTPVGHPEGGCPDIEILIREHHGSHHYWDRIPAHQDCLEAARRCFIEPQELRQLTDTARPS